MGGNSVKILNLLSLGNVGGIEVLCKNIGKMANYSNTFCFIFQEGKIYEEMLAQGSDVISLQDERHNGITLKKILRLRKIAKEYDIIVTHHASISLQFIYYILRHILKRKKYVMTVHSCFDKKTYYNYTSKIKSKIFAYLLGSNLKGSDGIVFVSEAGMKSYKAEFDFKDERTRIIYNGVICNQEGKECNKSKSLADKFRILYVGRLVEIKGVQLLVDAVNQMVLEGVNVELVIVGDGAYRTELEQQVKQFGLSDCIKFEGTQRELEKYYSKADVFVYPSICEEVFGISIVEAMAEGIPCVAFKVGGIPEIIQDGVNGAIAEEKDATQLKEAIFRIKELYYNGNIENISKSCFDTANKFSINNTVDCLEKYYKELLSE